MAANRYKGIIDVVNESLTTNSEWENRFRGYARGIKENGSIYENEKTRFRVNPPLYCYTNVSSVKDNSRDYDIRFCGQSIATAFVRKDGVSISTKNAISFGIKTSLEKEKWQSKESTKFRAAFTKELHKEERGKSREHHVENVLLAEFGKTKSTDKKLCNIQPIKLCGLFFQMPTPLSASIGEPTYAKKGGGIDILARVRHKDNSVRICVMELKDENTEKESPEKTMEQAVAYATFIARLLRSKSGNDWYDLFGFGTNVPEILTIDVAITMPYDEKRNENFEAYDKIVVCEKTYLKLYALYFQRDKNGKVKEFVGSLKNDMMPHNRKPKH